jgi:transposase InsO family protein
MKSTKKPTKTKKANQYNDLLKDMGIDERYTKVKTRTKFDHIKDSVMPMGDHNLQCDLLMLPKTKAGYRYLFVLLDLWSDELDVRALKTKESLEVLESLKSIFKSGKYIKKPKASIRTDSGSEFKSVFHQYLYDEGILHSVSLPNRHKQTGSVESVNRLLGRFFNTYMNNNGTVEWVDLLKPKQNLIKHLNDIRRIKDENPFTYDHAPPTTNEPKFKIGDIVIRKLDTPMNGDNNKEYGNFRTGDLRFDKSQPRKIVKVLFYPKNIRYMLDGFPQVSYTEDELLETGEEESKYNVRQIWDKKTTKGKVYYKVWFKGYLKKNSEWLLKENLIEDGLEDDIEAYENLV